MKRWMAWAAAVAVAIGTIAASQMILEAQSQKVGFVPVDVYGSRECLEGREAQLHIMDGQNLDYMNGESLNWDIRLPLAHPEEAQTDFYQGRVREVWSMEKTFATHTLFNDQHTAPRGSSLQVLDYGYGKVFRALAEQMEPNSTQSWAVTLSHHLQTHTPGIEIQYGSETYRCSILASCREFFLETGTQVSGQIRSLHSLFPVPVEDKDFLSVHLTTDKAGQLTSVMYNYLEHFPQVQTFAHMDDNGIYVVFQAVDQYSGEPREMGYPDGFGLYFIPWGVVYQGEDFFEAFGLEASGLQDTRTEVYPVVSSMEKRFSLEEGTQVLDVLGSQEQDTGILVTQEEGMVWMTVLKLSTGELMDKTMLMAYTGEISCHARNGIYLILDRENLAVVDSQGAVAMEVDLTEYPKVYDILGKQEASQMVWENGTFCALGRVPGNSAAILYALTLRDGALLGLTEYHCTLFQGTDSLGLQSIRFAP